MSNPTHSPAVTAALQELHRIKAPTKRAARVAALVLELPTQADVAAFTTELRIRAGVQDPTLLPETSWTTYRSGSQEPVETVGTAVLVNTLDGAENVNISWPSVYHHWGIMITFTWGGQTIVARSKDYQLTETYMSS